MPLEEHPAGDIREHKRIIPISNVNNCYTKHRNKLSRAQNYLLFPIETNDDVNNARTSSTPALTGGQQGETENVNVYGHDISAVPVVESGVHVPLWMCPAP